MATTYTPIATTTLGSAQANLTFSSISGSYTDLVLIVSATLSTASQQDLMFRFNSDSGSNYSNTFLYGTGSAAGSTRQSSQTRGMLDYYGSLSNTQPNTYIVNIMNYSNSTTYKTVISRANRADSGLDAVVNLWRSTSAITSIYLEPTNSYSFGAGSTFTLYGITAA